ncbi:uncharacterized protein EI97DRAFT_57017 [Westerdykella ornata]|uniref:Uncharacterized protein n=1 Tax=Westerdykella ornata TaxID=318751 RepID=A0A6A6JHG7_WESOR|nr:uncharacterized protein EI97DRAFT_57017 [Westerdykella ornata]KAF2275827.1 hypothetical protein EI97DRAFT_57017 [Westerdykella ornata]
MKLPTPLDSQDNLRYTRYVLRAEHTAAAATAAAKDMLSVQSDSSRAGRALYKRIQASLFKFVTAGDGRRRSRMRLIFPFRMFRSTRFSSAFLDGGRSGGWATIKRGTRRAWRDSFVELMWLSNLLLHYPLNRGEGEERGESLLACKILEGLFHFLRYSGQMSRTTGVCSQGCSHPSNPFHQNPA